METFPEQPTDYKSHMDKLDLHFKAHRNNTPELHKFFNIEWLPGTYFSDFETTCRRQVLLCDFPITLDQVIAMMTVNCEDLEPGVMEQDNKEKWRPEISERNGESL